MTETSEETSAPEAAAPDATTPDATTPDDSAPEATPPEATAPEATPPDSAEAVDTTVPEPTSPAEPEPAAIDEAPAATSPAPETTPAVADGADAEQVATEEPVPTPAATPASMASVVHEHAPTPVPTEAAAADTVPEPIPAPETTPTEASPSEASPSETAPTVADAPPAEQPAATEEPAAEETSTPSPVPTPAAMASVVHEHAPTPVPTEAAAADTVPEPIPAPDATPTEPSPSSGTTPAVAETPAAETPAAETPVATEEPAAPSPVPTPAAVASVVHEHPPTPVPAETAATPPADHASWGRVDEAGTVWVRTSTGERAVGSYPGTTPEGALAYFARKFEELEGQVGLLEQRVAAGGVSPKDADTSIKNLRESVTAAHAVGDLDVLGARLDALVVVVAGQRKKADAARSAARGEALVIKERIVAEAESLITSTDWKHTGDRLRRLLDEWKVAARLDRKTDDALWKRFSHARTAFDKHRRAHFAELDTQRSSAAEAKEKLIAEAEELSTSTDWAPTARRYRDLMTQWKAVGRARRDVEDELWGRFRAAQDTFFAARNAITSARDADLAGNLEKKKALLVEAEKLLPITDIRAARTALLSIHDRWEAAGHVPRNDKDAIEGRMRKVDDAVRAADDAKWKSSNPEALARAEATVAQLRSSIESFDAEAEKATEAGQVDNAAKAREAAAARREWLAEAERTLAEFS